METPIFYFTCQSYEASFEGETIQEEKPEPAQLTSRINVDKSVRRALDIGRVCDCIECVKRDPTGHFKNQINGQVPNLCAKTLPLNPFVTITKTVLPENLSPSLNSHSATPLDLKVKRESNNNTDSLVEDDEQNQNGGRNLSMNSPGIEFDGCCEEEGWPRNLSRMSTGSHLIPPSILRKDLADPKEKNEMEGKSPRNSGGGSSTHPNDERKFKCLLCIKAYTSKLSLARHMRVHRGDQPYQCRFNCGKRFSRVDNRNIHERIHTGEQPYKCGHCSTSFSQRSNAKTHVLTQHPFHD